MNSRQMQLSFEMKIGQFGNYDFYKPLQSHEMQDFLNEAQEMVLQELYEEFEQSEKIRTELSPLVKNQVFSSFTTGSAEGHTNGYIVDIPNEVLYPVGERCNISYIDCNSVSQTIESKVLPFTHDEYIMNVNNPYTKPSKDILWRMELGASGSYYKRHEIITDGSITLNSYNLRYIKRPTDLNLITTNTSELDPSVHDQIVDLAVQIALRSRPQPEQVKQNQES